MALAPAQIPEDWPRVACSEMVHAVGLDWHIQRYGRGFPLLLLHGTGASSHTWAPIAPFLEEHFEVLAIDMPGQGFTQLAPQEQCSLPGMSRAVGGLLSRLNFRPEFIAGHSAGAAVAATLCLQGACNPKAIFGLNAALLPFGRAAAPVFSQAAKLLAASPVFTQIVALHAVSRKPIERMLLQTGSETPEEMMRCYRRLIGNPRHVAGTLRMMSNWDLVQLEKNLGRLEPVLRLLTCDGDQVVSPKQSEELLRRYPQLELRYAQGLGHLGHEEDPRWFAEELCDMALRRRP
ncbi:MAG: alpha/beta fold hydrolase [Congregibacter sp.]